MSDKVGTFSARWRSGVLDRLDRRSRQLDQSRSRLAERYVDEGLKMDEHPGIIFRDGPTGRRAALPAGPDIWQIVQLLLSSPKKGDSAIAETAELMNLSEVRLRLAVSYYASYPEDIDRRIKDNIEGAEAAEAAWLREQAILG
ncbi:MAG: hypothetical protein KDB66_00780 [Solirubrobacterales bacterium]|nr:hypothetical protein [Solirubrobacterales bacterium]